MNVQGIFSRQVGPLPLGLWVLGIAGGLGVAVYLRRHPGVTTPDVNAAQQDLVPPTGTGGAATSDPSTVGTVAPVSTMDSPDTTPTGGSPYASNAEWRLAAVRAGQAIGLGGIGSEGLVARYLAGVGLSAYEGAKMNLILAQVGPTPTAVKVSTVAVAPPKPAPPATNAQWVTAATAAVVARYKTDPTQTRTAMNAYVGGVAMTPTAKHLADLGVSLVGAPPVPILTRQEKLAEAWATGPAKSRRDTGSGVATGRR